MSKRIVAASVVAMIALATPPVMADGDFRVGIWWGGSHHGDDGHFYHCSITAKYHNNITVVFAINRDWKWSILLAHPQWTMTEGKRIPVAYRIDGGERQSAEAKAAGQDMVLITLPPTPAAFDEMRQGRLLIINTPGEAYEFALTDIAAALPTLSGCVERNLEPPNKQPKPTKAPPTPSPPPSQPASTPPASTPPKPIGAPPKPSSNPSANAPTGMRFRREILENNSDYDAIAVTLSGPIIKGDFDRYLAFSRALPERDRIVLFLLDSPGGSILEGLRFARYIAATNLWLMVDDGSTCASACFVLFASNKKRAVSESAFVGVHSAQIDGVETMDALAVTTLMARAVGEFGVPESIIGKMVTTPPGKMAWLTNEDMQAMRVRILAPSGQKPIGAAKTAPPTATGDATVLITEPKTLYPRMEKFHERDERAARSQAFADGLEDRVRYEQWFAGLTGAYRDGAAWWAANRSQKNAECMNTSDVAWNEGCAAGRLFLAPTDVRRRSEPEYRAGWNAW